MTMDHAEAHERLADLGLDPGGLSRLARAETLGSEDRAFLAHVRDCAACTAELNAARQLDRGLRFAMGHESGDATAARDTVAAGPISPPGWLRDAVLAAAHRDTDREPHLGPGRSAASLGRPAPRRRSLLRWPRLAAPQWAAVAALAVVVALAGGLAGRALLPRGGPAPDPSLVAAMATLDRVLAAPDHRVVTLDRAGGGSAGSVAWTAEDFVVLTSGLSAPPDGEVYRCWLEWSGRWGAVGSMEFVGATAYWAGATGEWARLMSEPGTRFVVTAEASGSTAEAPSGNVLLQAVLGS